MAEFLNLPTKEGQDNQNQILQQIANTLGVTTDALYSAVNLANQSAVNAENKIVDIENRFQQLTAQQQQDAEVVSARQSTVKSKTFASLDARLEEDEQDLKSHKAESATNAHLPQNVGLGNLSNVKQVEVVNTIFQATTDDVVFQITTNHVICMIVAMGNADNVPKIFEMFNTANFNIRKSIFEPENATITYDSANREVVITPKITGWTRYALLAIRR